MKRFSLLRKSSAIVIWILNLIDNEEIEDEYWDVELPEDLSDFNSSIDSIQFKDFQSKQKIIEAWEESDQEESKHIFKPKSVKSSIVK